MQNYCHDFMSSDKEIFIELQIKKPKLINFRLNIS